MKKRYVKYLTSLLLMTVLFGLFPITGHAASAGSGAGIVTMSYGSLNVRKLASTSAAIIKTLPKDSYVTLISKSGDWWYVEYGDGLYGYCSAEYITTVNGAWSAYTTGALNVRTGPGTNYTVIDWLQSGEHVVVLESSGSWRKVLLDGTKIGYVSGSYLRADSDSSNNNNNNNTNNINNSTLAYPAIYLTVPSYKQTDSRWANTRVGNSTIGKIGCSTVALAMAESYRTGTTIDPNAMKSRLSYTSGGAVYWPSYFSAYNGHDYLYWVYDFLEVSKTVLVGLKNNSGGQHWVVITGYTGGNTLSAANFTVNDPGSNTRTTLQQVINDYPNFYKIMYY